MTALDPAFAAQLRASPKALVRVIISAASDVDELLESLPDDVEVDHIFRLRAGVAAHGPSAAIIKIATSPLVARIEPDRPVTTQDE